MSKNSVRVVMIDDDEDDYKIVSGLLAHGEINVYETIWAKSFEEGLELLQAGSGDVFLIDYNLGSRNGLTLVKETGGRELGKPVIMLTGMEDPDVDLSAMEAGASYFLPKSSLLVDHLLERTIRYAIRVAGEFERAREIDRLRYEKQAAEAASESKSKFLASVSHEIRTPLSAILGFTELAKISKDGVDTQRCVQSIERNARYLLDLVNDLLDLAKIEAGKFEVMLWPCEWRTVIRDVMESLRPRAEQMKTKIMFEDNAGIPNHLLTDGRRLKQILMNILGNAVKFTEGGTISLTVEAMANFKMFIEDTGPGISEQHQALLFQPFTQGDARLQKRFGGTGLGLNLSRELARALGGDLKLVSSRLGSGSKFSLELPAVWREAQKSAPVRLNLDGFSLKGLNVLLAEDCEDNRVLVERLLRQLGARVRAVLNGRAAVVEAQQARFDVILMDIQMPEMNGLEATQRIRRFDPATPIVALSAHASAIDRQHAMANGFSEYLTKPLDIEKLVATLSRYKISRPSLGDVELA